MNKFSIILSDPPWSYKRKGGAACPEKHYTTLSQADLCALPVADIAADNCALCLWATLPLLPEALETIRAWGFKYRSCLFVWVKTRKNFNPAQPGFFAYDSFHKDRFFGCGEYTRSNTELCLIATRGKPLKRLTHAISQLIFEPAREHSRKPGAARDLIVKLFGDLPRLEMFARQSAPGWTAIGNEITGRDIREDLEILKAGEK